MPGLNIPHRKVTLPNKQPPSEGLKQRIEKLGEDNGVMSAEECNAELNKTYAVIETINFKVWGRAWIRKRVLKALDSEEGKNIKEKGI